MIKVRITLLVLAFSIGAAQAAKYDVEVKGHDVGKAELSIRRSDDAYSVSLALHPMFLARLLADDMTETVSGSVRDNHFSPVRYRRVDDDGAVLLNVDFGGTSVAVTDEDGNSSAIAVSMRAQDPLSQLAQIQYDVKRGALQPYYDLVTDRAQQRYTTKQHGMTVALTQAPSGRRQIILSYDKHYELQRMEKRKEGKINFVITRVQP